MSNFFFIHFLFHFNQDHTEKELSTIVRVGHALIFVGGCLIDLDVDLLISRGDYYLYNMNS